MSRLEKCLEKFGATHPRALEIRALLDYGIPEKRAFAQVLQQIDDDGAALVRQIEDAGGSVLVKREYGPGQLEQRESVRQRVPDPESTELTLAYGRVENELQALLDGVKGDTSKLTWRRLAKMFGAPKKRKGKEKLDANVRPTGYTELKEYLDWALANDAAGDWYREFGQAFAELVGEANLQEASVLFGITSAQNAAETNYADTLHIMSLARQYDPVTNEADFRNAVKSTPRPDGQRLKITGTQIDNVVNLYQSGTYEGGLKVSNYMQLIRAKGENSFNPWSVQDVHMARVFGYRTRDIDKKTGQVVDTASFPSSGAIRYGQWMTTLLAKEYDLRPDQVQAHLWFYSKSNLSPKKKTANKRSVGDGTYQSAAAYAAPEVAKIQQLVDAGKFDKTAPLTQALAGGTLPNFKSPVQSDPYTNVELLPELEALAEARAPRVMVSTKPGNARGYGFPEGTELRRLEMYHKALMDAITDDTGQIKILKEMGVVHKVRTTYGTWEGLEPTFELVLPGESMQTARMVASLLGDAFLQDAAVTAKPSWEGPQFGLLVRRPDGSAFDKDQLAEALRAVNPDQTAEGVQFSVTPDGTGLKFLDGVYWDKGDQYGEADSDAFMQRLSGLLGQDYSFEFFSQEGDLVDLTGPDAKDRSKVWDQGGLAGRPDLQRAAIRDLYQPTWSVYREYRGYRFNFPAGRETGSPLGRIQQAGLVTPDQGTDAAWNRRAGLPIRNDGKVPLTHWGSTPDLGALDPEFFGSAAAGAETTRANSAFFVPRTYFGLPGYRVESTVKTKSSAQYFATVDPGQIYDVEGDPLGFYDQAALETNNPQDLDARKEQLIRDAGYLGYWTTGRMPAVALFDVTPVKPIEAGNEAVWGEEGGDLAQAEFDTVMDPWSLSPEDLYNHPELRLAEQEVDAIPLIDPTDPARQDLRERIANEVFEEQSSLHPIKAEKKVWLVLGPSASGKSSLVETRGDSVGLAEQEGAIVVDSDHAKEKIPEFNGGIGANAVHEESKAIGKSVSIRALSEGLNIVEPLVGAKFDKVQKKIAQYQELGYTVGVRMVDLSWEETFRRSVARYQNTGRFIPPQYLYESVGYGPAETYLRLLKEGTVDDIEAFNSAVPFGQPLEPIPDYESHAAGRTLPQIRTRPGRVDAGRDGANQGQPEGQLGQGKSVVRGTYRPLDDGHLIRLFNSSSASTFMHEAGHMFLQLELTYGSTEDTQKILEWLDAKSVDDVLVRPGETVSPSKRARHERWARTFEAYLFEGKAPSQDLRSAFARMASWLKQVYRSLHSFLNRPDVQLNDEVRGIFDRLLATEDEIAAAEIQGQYAQDYFANAESAGMNASEWEQYQERRKQATERAEETLQTKLLSQLRRRTEKWWKEESREIAERKYEELDAEKVYAVQAFLRGPKRDDNSNRLNSELVKELFGGQVPPKIRGMTHKEGTMNPDNVASGNGFDDGFSMLKSIMESPTQRKRAAELAEQEMIERHGDILNDGTLEQEAQAAAHNETRGQMILHELRMTNKRTGARTPDRTALKAHAEALIGRTPLNEVMPERYHRAEVKAAKRAAAAAATGDMVEAAEAKLSQAVNFYLWRAANKARDRRDSVRRQLQAMKKRSYKPSKVHPEYIRKLKVYLAAYDFRVSVPNDVQVARQNLINVARWVKAQTTDTREMQILDKQLDGVLAAEDSGEPGEFTIKNYRHMTMDELDAVHDQARHLRYVGGQLADSVTARKNAYHNNLAEALRQRFKSRKAPKEGTLRERFGQAVKGYGANILLHADGVLRYLDGYKDNGPLYNAIKRPIDEAVTDRLLPMQEKAGDDLAALYSAQYSDKELREMNRRQDVADRSMSKWEMISLALNWGNQGGREALLASVKNGQSEWSEVEISEVLNKLEKKDWDFVQSVWDYIGTYKEALFDIERKRNGVAPPAVEPASVATRFGNYPGGYFPLKYDPKSSVKVSEEDVSEMMKGVMMGRFGRAHTKDGMLKERVGSGGRPVWLDMAVLHRHLNEVVNFVALSDAISEVQDVLASKSIRDAMEATGNKEFHDGLDLWLKDTATQEILGGDVASRTLRAVRTGFTVSKLGWNVSTILLQPFGILQSMPVIGYSYMMKGLVALAKNPVGKNSVIRQVQNRSAFMRARSSNFNKDIRDTLDKLNGDPNKPGFLPDGVRRSFFEGIVFTQRYVDVATWLGAYERAKVENPMSTDKDRMYIADRAVARSQASGIWSDRTPIERGTVSPTVRGSEWVRIWTALGSYFFAKGNIAVELVAKTDPKRLEQDAKLITSLMVLFTVEAVLVGALRGQTPDEDDDDETLAGFAAVETIKSIFSSLPMAREAVSAASGFQGGGVWGSLSSEIGKVSQQLAQGELDAPLVKSINNLGGIAFKYPSGAINRAGDALARDIQGEEVDAIEYLMWREKD